MQQWLDDPEFIFDASKYVQSGYEKADGEFSQEDRDLFGKVRTVLPEVSEWGDLPIGVALGDYFQQVYMVSWLELSENQLSREHLVEFLAFLHYQQTVGDWPWGYAIDKLDELINSEKQS